jgi:hypothetical protein
MEGFQVLRNTIGIENDANSIFLFFAIHFLFFLPLYNRVLMKPALVTGYNNQADTSYLNPILER